MGWDDAEPFADKIEHLLEQIDQLKTEFNKLSLIGVSAGASAALIAYSKRTEKINAVALISGKIQNPQTINPRYFVENPAFKESIFTVQTVSGKLKPEQSKRIMSIHPYRDQTVPVGDTIIDGAVEKRVLGFTHIQGIFYCLVFKGWMIASFLKRV